MNAKLTRWWCLFSVISSVITQAANEPPIDVLIEQKGGGAAYSINGMNVPREKILDEFGRLMVARKDRPAVIVRCDHRLPLLTVMEVRRAALKAGFDKVRLFCFAESRHMMSELEMDRPAVPFARNPGARTGPEGK